MKNILLICFLSLFIIACVKDNQVLNNDQGEPVLENYSYQLPQDLLNNAGTIIADPTIIVNPSLFKVDDNIAKLGRALFYDKKLSLNNKVACASCHHQDKAFSDGLAFSPGFEGKTTTRSSMAIINPITQNNLFWDSRSQTIQDLSLKPVQNHIEMGMEDLNYLEKKLAKTTYYPKLFQEAFGTPTITKERISLGITHFTASIVSKNSKFDRVMKGEEIFTPLESLGHTTFMINCSSCHAGVNFSAPDGINEPYGGGSITGENPQGTANIGLDLIETDKGKEKGKFKIPTLRNIALTAPYMHDGRFKTLDEALEHYNSGIKANPNLDPKFKDSKGNVIGIRLTESDKLALIAFLNTLTDYDFIKDKKYSNPFKQ